MDRTLNTVRPELVEGLSFLLTEAIKKSAVVVPSEQLRFRQAQHERNF
jgi:hypothetical protein